MYMYMYIVHVLHVFGKLNWQIIDPMNLPLAHEYITICHYSQFAPKFTKRMISLFMNIKTVLFLKV